MNPLDSSIGLWGLFVSAFVSSTLAPGGSEAVLALLASQSKISPASLLLVATLGNTLGALTTWLIGMAAALGYPLDRFTGKPGRKALSAVRRWGVSALLFSWLPLIGDVLCLAGGWLRLPFLPSLLAIFAGKGLRYAVIIHLFA